MSRSRTGGRGRPWGWSSQRRTRGGPPIIDRETGRTVDLEKEPIDRPREFELLHGDPDLPRFTFTVLPSSPGESEEKEAKAPPPEPGGEWRSAEWSAADLVPERAALVGRVRRAFGRERFPLTVEEVQREFLSVDGPFEILPKVGVFLSGGRNISVMSHAFIDLWNYTPRPALGDRSPMEELRRRTLAAGGRRSVSDVDASLIACGPHNLDLLPSPDDEDG